MNNKERRHLVKAAPIFFLTFSWLLLFGGSLQAQALRKIRIGSTTPSITTLPSEIAANCSRKEK